MAPPVSETIESSFLSRLERAEARLLAWGVIDGAFTWNELLGHASASLDSSGLLGDSAEDLIARLLEQRLLFPEATDPSRYRTRMAETIRLTATLRQIFNPGPDGWRLAPRLVADYRMSLRERRYPIRDVSADEFVESISAARVTSDVGLKALRALLRPDDHDFRSAEFQKRATQQALGDCLSSRSTGIVVAAGTGSGKTLAFYLPALTWASTAIDATHWTKTLAIYPRVELIKDQLQTAYVECRRLDALHQSLGKRKMTLGALFGDVPTKADSVPQWSSWKAAAGGHVCPLMKCPHCQVGTLLWRDSDRRAGAERMECRDCGGSIEHDEVVLTRHRMKAEPPDILFTSTEMLNKEMSNDWNRHLFGLGDVPLEKRPRFLLLDEIHVNQGTTGAQTGLLIRRWRHALRSPVTIVGLSATLNDARGFFAALVGLPEPSVNEVSPIDHEMTSEGMEYSLALRGDPSSGTSLMSTTIQLGILLRRMLDTDERPSKGLYGQRVYAFTDQLDSVNRLYWNLLSAEGWDGPRRPLNRSPRSLAAFRSPARDDRFDRSLEGQSWDSAATIGHGLDDTAQLRIGRTSSQDAGVDLTTDIVVATASIEVGFDDSQAAAVIQHKAPREAAQFIQRRGRAGRSRGMRPWTVVVLSDYGRDRLAYQQYEELFDPSLGRQTLPLKNRYVLRMQAGFSLLDWLSSKASRGGKGSIWDDTARAARKGKQVEAHRQAAILASVEQLLANTAAQSDLRRHLARSLQIEPTEADALMWEPPRALMTEVVPTLHRRLATRWATMTEGEGTDRSQRTPLPEFLPENLFTDLLVPEVQLTIPVANNQDPRVEGLGVLQTLTEFCPGRASRRYAVEHSHQRHWIPVPLDASAGLGGADTTVVYVDGFCDGETLGEFAYLDEAGATRTIECIRPTRFAVSMLPTSVRDTTTARPNWSSQILRATDGDILDLPSPSSWGALVTSAAAHLHVSGHQISVRRFYRSVTVDLKLSNGTSRTFDATLAREPDSSSTLGRDPVALGFEMDVDAIKFAVDNDRLRQWLSTELPLEASRASRAAWFSSCVESSDSIPDTVNVFQRRWLAVMAQTALLEIADEEACDLSEAHALLRRRGVSSSLIKVLNVVVGSHDFTETHEVDEVVDPQDQGRLYSALSDACHDSLVVNSLDDLLSLLYVELDSSAAFTDWQCRRARTTLGSALVEAMMRISPQLDSDILIVDANPGPTSDDARENSGSEIWISETVPGGAGILEQFVRDYSLDPRRFWRIAAGILRSTDAEEIDTQLQRVLTLAPEPNVARAMSEVRQTFVEGQEALAQAVAQLRLRLAEMGVSTSHSVQSAVAMRILRPGTSPETDAALGGVIGDWRASEDRFGIDVDVRTQAYLASADQRLDGVLTRRVETNEMQQRMVRYASLLGLLWFRGGVARSLGFGASNRFHTQPPLDRLLLHGLVSDATSVIHLEDPDWREQLVHELATSGTAQLRTDLDNRRGLQVALNELLQSPCEVGFLLLYPRLAMLTRSLDGLTASFELRESLQ